jgi:hypothetical protein
VEAGTLTLSALLCMQTPVALATSQPERRVKPAIDRLNLANYFDAVVTAEDNGSPEVSKFGMVSCAFVSGQYCSWFACFLLPAAVSTPRVQYAVQHVDCHSGCGIACVWSLYVTVTLDDECYASAIVLGLFWSITTCMVVAALMPCHPHASLCCSMLQVEFYYMCAAQQLQRPFVRCIVVGDSNRSVEAAHELGMKSVIVTGPNQPAWNFSGADLVVRSLSSLSFVNMKSLFGNEDLVESQFEMEEEPSFS